MGMSNSDSNIIVGIRIRPITTREIDRGESNITRVQDNFIVVLDPVDIKIGKNNMGVLHRSKEKQYLFDHIFDTKSKTVEV